MATSPFALSQALLRAGDVWAQAVERFLQERFGISHAQFLVLDELRRHPGSKQGDLAIRLGRTKGNMTGVLGRLEEAGLVRRERVVDNRRAYALSLTEKGHMVTLVTPELTSFAQHLLGDLSASERAVLAAGLERLEKALASADPSLEATAPNGTAKAHPGNDGHSTEDGDLSQGDGPPRLVDPRPHRPVRVVLGRRGEKERWVHGPGPAAWPGEEW